MQCIRLTQDNCGHNMQWCGKNIMRIAFCPKCMFCSVVTLTHYTECDESGAQTAWCHLLYYCNMRAATRPNWLVVHCSGHDRWHGCTNWAIIRSIRATGEIAFVIYHTFYVWFSVWTISTNNWSCGDCRICTICCVCGFSLFLALSSSSLWNSK